MVDLDQFVHFQGGPLIPNINQCVTVSDVFYDNVIYLPQYAPMHLQHIAEKVYGQNAMVKMVPLYMISDMNKIDFGIHVIWCLYYFVKPYLCASLFHLMERKLGKSVDPNFDVGQICFPV